MNTMGMMTALFMIVATGGPKPSVAGVTPDSVWVLVDAAFGAADEGRRRALLREAEERARVALAGHEDSAAHRYALAVVLGARANSEGNQGKVRAAAELKEELDAILELDPGHVGARHLLGRLHAGVRRMSRVTRWVATNLLGGDELKQATWEAAEQNLAYAELHGPEVADHHLQLALLYRDTGRPELATHEIAHVLGLPANTALELAVLEEARRVGANLE